MKDTRETLRELLGELEELPDDYTVDLYINEGVVTINLNRNK